MSMSIQIIADSMNNVRNAIHGQYTISKGWDHLIEKISEPFAHCIRTQSQVKKITRKNDIITVEINQGHHDYDAIALAVPPNVALRLLHDIRSDERDILSQFTTTTTQVYLHTDLKFLRNKQT